MEECLLSGWEGVATVVGEAVVMGVLGEGVGVVVEEEEAVEVGEAVEEGVVNTLNRQLH